MKLKYSLILLLFMPALANAWVVDFAMTAITPMQYQVTGTRNFTLTITQVRDGGFSAANIYWQLNNGPIHSVTKSQLDLQWSGGKIAWVIDSSFKVVFPSAGNYKLKAWIKTTPVDVNPANDTLTVDVKVFNSLPKKNVLMEVYNDQDYMPNYYTDMYNENLALTNPAYILVNFFLFPNKSLFNADVKAVGDEYSTSSNALMLDRYKFPFQYSIVEAYLYNSPSSVRGIEVYGQHEQFYEPVEVYFDSLAYDTLTRELKVSVAAKFYDTLNGDYRFNVYLTENGVVDSQVGAPTPASYIRNHVLRAMLAGPWGQPGSVPASVSSGSTWNYQFTYIIPAGWNVDSMNMIGLLQKYSADKLDRRILNSVLLSPQTALSVKKHKKDLEDVTIYPNPNNGTFTLHISSASFKTASVAVCDIIGGRVVYSGELHSASEVIALHDVPRGIYLVRLQVDDAVTTRQLTIE